MPSVISIKLLFNFIKITLRHGCSPLNLLHIFSTPFPKNTYGWLLLFRIFQHSIEMMEYIMTTKNTALLQIVRIVNLKVSGQYFPLDGLKPVK